jgi:Uma2 family endonuclease
MGQPALRQGGFSFRDYCRWPEGERWELLDGRAHAMAPPSWAHQTVVFELGRQLGNLLVGQACQARSGPLGVRLPQADEADDEVRTVLEPDLLVVCDPSKIDTRGVRGAPDVIIEVLAPSTAAFDQIEKRRAYERAGVRELWLVDMAKGLLTIYRHTGTAFAPPEIVHARGRVALVALPGVDLDLDFIVPLRATLQPTD